MAAAAARPRSDFTNLLTTLAKDETRAAPGFSSHQVQRRKPPRHEPNPPLSAQTGPSTAGTRPESITSQLAARRGAHLPAHPTAVPAQLHDVLADRPVESRCGADNPPVVDDHVSDEMRRCGSTRSRGCRP